MIAFLASARPPLRFPRSPRALVFASVFASLFAPLVGRAGVSVDSALIASGYSQNFDGLPASGNFTWANNTTLPGWYALNTAGTFNASAVSIDGTSNMADLVIGGLGTVAATDRALAYHTRENAKPTYLGLEFNNGSRELTGFNLTYTPEQWRESGSARNLTLAVQYRVGATAADLNATTGWTTLAGQQFTSAVGGGGGALGATATLSTGTLPVTILAGSSLWLRWTTSNSATSTTSSNDILAVDNVTVAFSAIPESSAPAFTQHPLTQAVSVGETATFTALASGNPAPTYQWLFDDSPIPTATSATLVLNNVQSGQAGTYKVVATNSLGSATSDPAVLSVSSTLLPPQITVPPADTTANAGSSVTLSVTATGSGPFTYQWYHGITLLGGQTAANLTIEPVTVDSAGSYTVTVTNSVNSVTSTPATLTVNLPPVILSGPGPQFIAPGGTATFSVTLSGATPFTYQWKKGATNIAAPAGTAASLVLTNVQIADAASYSVTVTNGVGNATSAAALLTVLAPPAISVQPQAQTVALGSTATLSVLAAGSGPFTYQWFKNDEPVPTATSASLSLFGVSTAAAGTYRVEVGNASGTTPSASVLLTVAPALADAAFNLTGFAQATTGGGIVAESSPGYRKVTTPLEFANALFDKTGTIKVIEIMNDLDLGWLEVGPDVQAVGPFRAHASPKLHPRLLVTGVSLIDIQNKAGLTIFSANGATIRHATLNFKSCNNIIIRNLKFDEMWEWDEATKGDYDSNDWDFIDLGNSGTVYNVWVDHCTFTKAYDGISDIKKGSYNITFSWNKYIGDDGATNPNSFVRQQLAVLEANRAAYPFYNFLRNNGFSFEDIAFIHQGHDKTHLIGATSLTAENADHTLTFHHQWLLNPWDRLPRLRAGNVHNYNLYVDATVGRQAKALRDARAAAMSVANRNTLNNTYNFNVFLNGSISTEGGAVLVEKSVYLDIITPLRNNQTDITDPTYTGKILGLDTICRMTTDAGVATTVRGNSTDVGNPMGPFQAPVIPFSWNLPGGVLPYSAPMDDPAALAEIVAVGAGAGRLTWHKSNWLKVSYPAAVTFADWIAQWPLASAAPEADPDADGLPNLVEYTLGLRPDQWNGQAIGPQLLPGAGGAWLYRYTRDRLATGVALVVEISTDLLTWSPAPTPPVLENVNGSLETLSVALAAGGPRFFVRARASQ